MLMRTLFLLTLGFLVKAKTYPGGFSDEPCSKDSSLGMPTNAFKAVSHLIDKATTTKEKHKLHLLHFSSQVVAGANYKLIFKTKYTLDDDTVIKFFGFKIYVPLAYTNEKPDISKMVVSEELEDVLNLLKIDKRGVKTVQCGFNLKEAFINPNRIVSNTKRNKEVIRKTNTEKKKEDIRKTVKEVKDDNTYKTFKSSKQSLDKMIGKLDHLLNNAFGSDGFDIIKMKKHEDSFGETFDKESKEFLNNRKENKKEKTEKDDFSFSNSFFNEGKKEKDTFSNNFFNEGKKEKDSWEDDSFSSFNFDDMDKEFNDMDSWWGEEPKKRKKQRKPKKQRRPKRPKREKKESKSSEDIFNSFGNFDNINKDFKKDFDKDFNKKFKNKRSGKNKNSFFSSESSTSTSSSYSSNINGKSTVKEEAVTMNKRNDSRDPNGPFISGTRYKNNNGFETFETIGSSN